MWQPDLGHVQCQPGVLAHEHASRARVVEVDVREQEMPDVAELHPTAAQLLAEDGNAARGPAVEQREPVVGLEEVGADPAWIAEVQEVHRLRCHARDAI